LARKTVRRALRADRPPGRQLPVGKPSTSPRETLIDAFKDDVKRYLAECADLSAVQIHRRLVRERQFRGSVYVVRRYVRTLRERKRRAFLQLAYLPGECAQVDWAHFGHTEIRGAKRRVSAFVMVMAYSRLLYVELTLSERMDAFLEAHDRAFRYFGGVPKVTVQGVAAAGRKPCLWVRPVEALPLRLRRPPPSFPLKAGIHGGRVARRGADARWTVCDL